MRGFLPHTEEDLREMLEAVGVGDLDELFSTVPEDCRFRGELTIPAGIDESGVAARLGGMAAMNRPAGSALSFLGGGVYDRIVPAMTGQILSRPEFYTAYTPYQPEVSQGTLQVIFEFQTMIARLTGMDVANASLYDGASAVAEAVLMAGAATRRHRVLLPESLQPSIREVVETYTVGQDYVLETLPCEASGRLDAGALARALADDVAALVLQSPNYFGVLENLGDLAGPVKDAGALLLVHSEPTSLALLEPPGSFGADIVTCEGQGLGLPMNYGGPLLGVMAVSQKHLRRLPGRLVGKTVDGQGREGFVLTLQTREQHIRREKATSNICTNQGLMMLAATVYLADLGEGGLRELAGNLASSASGLAGMLETLPGYELAFDGDFYQEFVLRTPVPAAEIVAAGEAEGIFPGIAVEGCERLEGRGLLVAVSEKHRPEDFERLAAFLGRWGR